MKFNEDSRVKIPAILHLMRLGYEYLSLKNTIWDIDTNIFTEIFFQNVARINPEVSEEEIKRLFDDIKLLLDNEDLGKAFYEKLIDQSGIKLIDFQNFEKNSFHVVTELPYKNDDEEFRPDITLLINGLPIVFIEVKKPHNKDGVIAERDRINKRCQNHKFRRFINITQFMIFSNNMEYSDEAVLPIEGAFYASPSYKEPIFNYFREEEIFNLTSLLKQVDDDRENKVLKDNNLEVIKTNPEFITNKSPESPTNRLSTSLLSKDRLAFLLKYALAYVLENEGMQKHIMRYPQVFATKAIGRKLEEGVTKGIIWHTQGSGKTALAFYNVKYLTEFYQKKGIIPKFYFIVDRLDLLQQAHREFTSRGLTVHTINSRDEFSKDIKATKVIHNDSGKPEITVINIQKFKDDPDVITTIDYDLNIQRVYFLDEVHRSYNPIGSFLANLYQSDRNAIKIGLTGTPIIIKGKAKSLDFSSKQLFGNYIHKYYYNASIADGYTLRLIREEIATNYKLKLQEALKTVPVQQGKIKIKQAYAHHNFVEPMLDYIITDFEASRAALNDSSIGGMIICDSAEQAKEMHKIFQEKYACATSVQDGLANPNLSYREQLRQKNKVRTADLILHDVGTKEDRKDWVSDFKAGKTDFMIVYNMLLTGFDAKRLKKLYLGRVIKKHNLLQALTRVNRTYKDFRYGYVVDFADIEKEFDKTNRAYFEELQDELGDEIEHYSNLFKSQEEIAADIEHIKDTLYLYDTENAEIFSQQIGQIENREQIITLKKVLADAKSLYNIIRLQGDYQFLQNLDFNKLTLLYRETCNHLDLLNAKESLESSSETSNILNIALEDVFFKFIKISEEELVLADKLKNTLRQTREALASNFDQQDPKFTTLKEELERLFKKKKLTEVTQEDMAQNIDALNKIYSKIKELNRQNELIRQKYNGDRKYTRIHKRLIERKDIAENHRKIFEALKGIKSDTDDAVMQNTSIIDNEKYFERSVIPIVINQFQAKQNIKLNVYSSNYINKLVVAEYINEFKTGAHGW